MEKAETDVGEGNLSADPPMNAILLQLVSALTMLDKKVGDIVSTNVILVQKVNNLEQI